MSRYALIEKELNLINDAKFHTVCNAFLTHEYGGDLQSLGTAQGKEKTRKGKPDALIVQKDGTYILAEYTTKDKSHNSATFLKKLQDDLKACLNFEKLGIEAGKIAAIVICCNSRLSLSDIEALKQMCSNADINLRLVGIDTLTLYLFTKGRFYAHQYLNIPFDTGQILPKKDFLKLYSKRNLATPLDNQLFGRQKERLELVEAIEKNNIIVVSGPAGVGKSRLCLQAIDDFLTSHSNYAAYYIMHKTGGIIEELAGIIETRKDYIFFVDDANRQIGNLLSVIYSSHDIDNATVKIVATVRNYAKEEVLKVCRNSQTLLLHLRKLNNKTIASIISSDEFKIHTTPYLSRIVEISDGNPRIAIMAARIIQNNSDTKLLNDASNIYEAYFQSIIDDKQLFKDKDTLKAIGLISFFYSLDLEDDSTRAILRTFQISYDKFLEIVLTLEELELVEVYMRYTVRISEQMLATYFFYKVFIQENLLDFEILLSRHCGKYYSRIKDIVGPVLASFGERDALKRVRSVLMNHWNTIQNDFDRSTNFLHVFGTSLPDQAFLFISRYCATLRSITESNSRTFFEPPISRPIEHPVIKVLLPFFKSENIREAITAVELSIMYVKKIPSALGELLSRLREKFLLTHYDVLNNLDRQKALYNYLVSEVGRGIANDCIFFSIFPEILLGKLSKKHFYTRNHKSWQIAKPIKELRGRFWNDLNKYFQQNTEFCRWILEKYIRGLARTSVTLLRFDEVFVFNILTTHFKPSLLQDSYLVHQYLTILDVYYSPSPLLKKLNHLFFYEAVIVFATLNAEDLFKQHSSGWVMNEEKIRTLRIHSMNDFKKIYSLLIETYPLWEEKHKMHYTLGFWLSTIITQNPQLGMDALKYIIKDGNKLGIYPSYFFETFFGLPTTRHEQLFILIKHSSFLSRDHWMSEYISELPKEFATESLMHDALHFYATGKSLSTINSYDLDKFLPFDEDIHEKVLLLLLSRMECGNQFDYELDEYFFIENKALIKKHFQVCKKVFFYLKAHTSFDSYLSAFFSLYEVDDSILFDYINLLQAKKEFSYHRGSHHYSLSKIWDYPNAPKSLEQVIVKFRDVEVSTYIGHTTCLFFHYLNEQDKVNVDTFLKWMVDSYKDDAQILNILLDISRTCLKESFLSLVKYFLTANDDLSVFKSIHWAASREEGFSGYTMDRQLIAAQLQAIYEAIGELPHHTRYIEHLNYLAQKIQVLQDEIAQLQKSDFMSDYYRRRHD